MTVQYATEVAEAQLLGIIKLMCRWHGSIYQALWKEAIIYLIVYYIVMIIYRFGLHGTAAQEPFEHWVVYCRAFTDQIPVSFVLGFFVSVVFTRWWNQYNAIPWSDRVALKIAAYVQGSGERVCMIRRTLIRYCLITQHIVFRMVSPVVTQRFPTMEHLVKAGLMTDGEREALEEVDAPGAPWWVPGLWGQSLATECFRDGLITDEIQYRDLLDEMLDFRGAAGTMLNYDWVSVPLVYVQVVSLAVYLFFGSSLFGRQWIYKLPDYAVAQPNYFDFYFPLFSMLQFLFYVGWLKVAETLLCPYGSDPDDFELNWILERNVVLSYQMVDTHIGKHPPLEKDGCWGQEHPKIPYTEETTGITVTGQAGQAGKAVFKKATKNVRKMTKKVVFSKKRPEGADGAGDSRNEELRHRAGQGVIIANGDSTTEIEIASGSGGKMNEAYESSSNPV